jgi:hypothetical protein
MNVQLIVSARVCSSHFKEDDFMRDLYHELLNEPVRKILKSNTIPTLNLTLEGQEKKDRKRKSSENRSALANKRARQEIIEDLLKESSSSSLTKDAEVQVDSLNGNFLVLILAVYKKRVVHQNMSN